MATARSLNGGQAGGNDYLLGVAALETRWSFVSISVARAAGGGRSLAPGFGSRPLLPNCWEKLPLGGGARLPVFLSYLLCNMGVL